MDFGRIMQMIINQLLRRAVNGGVNAAMRQMSKRSGPVSDADHEQTQAAKDASRRARQAAKLTRKF